MLQPLYARHHLRVEFSIMSRGTRTIEIYRYDPDVDAAPRMQTYTIELLAHQTLGSEWRFCLPPPS